MKTNRTISFPGYGLSFYATEHLYPRIADMVPARSTPFNLREFITQAKDWLDVFPSFWANMPGDWEYPQQTRHQPYVGYVIKDTGGNMSWGVHLSQARSEASYASDCGVHALSTFDEVAMMLKTQRDGRDGLLFTNGTTNNLYIQGVAGTSVIRTRFYRGRWALGGECLTGKDYYSHPDAQLLFPVLKKPFAQPSDIHTLPPPPQHNYWWRRSDGIPKTKQYSPVKTILIPGKRRPYDADLLLESCANVDGLAREVLSKPIRLGESSLPRFLTQLEIARTVTYEQLIKSLPVGCYTTAHDVLFFFLRMMQAQDWEYPQLTHDTTVSFLIDTGISPTVITITGRSHYSMNYYWEITGSKELGKRVRDLGSSREDNNIVVCGRGRESREYPEVVSYLDD